MNRREKNEPAVRVSLDKQDMSVLRGLARQVREIAAHPVQEERKQLWTKVNRLERCRVPLLLRMNNLFWHEVVPERAILCKDSLAREYERRLRLQIWQWENVDDDCVTEPVAEYVTSARYPRRIQPRKIGPGTETLGAYHVQPVIEADSDIDKIIIDNECRVDRDATARNREWTEEVFGDILTVVRAPPWLSGDAFDYVCEIRGMDNVFMDMCERPEWLEEVMRRLFRADIDRVKYLEKEGALTLNNSFQPLYSGGQSYTDELPAEGFNPNHVRLKDVWGFTLAQSSVSISPDMHERFITQFEREYHELFGLTGVGCGAGYGIYRGHPGEIQRLPCRNNPPRNRHMPRTSGTAGAMGQGS